MRALLLSRASVRIGVPALAATALTVGLAGSASAATATRTVTDGGTTYNLTLNAPDTLSASGEVITVTGSGYNTAQGVYVALCKIPAAGAKPGPCLGGQDETGTTGASHWVNNLFGGTVANSSKFTAGGSFSANIYVHPVINDQVDCTVDECAIFTKADHFDAEDRKYDVAVPVTFE
ncbi:hypothetical protein [Streptomyces sp. N35]|uniref:hypothetical protein n=1 Tax=Streptomyces sp. N35 TaxID=2795730 RepID=UPI0018F70F92|nr:hypothetical protein [Streptomyces sp. N35]